MNKFIGFLLFFNWFFVSLDAADGRLILYNTHTKERLQFNYNPNQRESKHSYQINWFCRSRIDNQAFSMDRRVLCLLDEIQDHFNKDAVIHIISAFRSKYFNNWLRKKGRAVAKHSYHVKGKAIDFRIPGVDINQIRDFAWQLQQGGVGYYKTGFIHIDTGPVRNWPNRYFKRAPLQLSFRY